MRTHSRSPIPHPHQWTLQHLSWALRKKITHYNEIIMGVIASQITSLTIVYSTVYSGVDQRKHQSSASLAFVRGIHRWPVNSPHKWPVTRKMFPFDDVIMCFITGGHCIMKCIFIEPHDTQVYVSITSAHIAGSYFWLIWTIYKSWILST